MILSVTGHRPDKLGGYRLPNPVYNEVVQKLDQALMILRPEKVITGMALGVDQWVAELCVENGLPFVAAIPFPNFSTPWPQRSQEHYRYLLSKAERVHICDQSPIYSPDLLWLRNRWMVDNSDAVLAVRRSDLAGTRSGGTNGTVDYARQKRKTIHIIELSAEALTIAINAEVLAQQFRERRAEVANRPAPPQQMDLMQQLAIQGATTRATISVTSSNSRQPSMLRVRDPQQNGKPEKAESVPYKRVIDVDFD